MSAPHHPSMGPGPQSLERKMTDVEMKSKMFVDLMLTELDARGAVHKVTSRAEVFIAAGLELDQVLEALKIDRGGWTLRVDSLRDWEALNRVASRKILSEIRADAG